MILKEEWIILKTNSIVKAPKLDLSSKSKFEVTVVYTLRMNKKS